MIRYERHEVTTSVDAYNENYERISDFDNLGVVVKWYAIHSGGDKTELDEDLSQILEEIFIKGLEKVLGG